MSNTPTLNGQLIGIAERATRALLDRLLAEHGLDFSIWVPLNVLVDCGGTIDEEAMVSRLVDGLKIDDASAHAALGRAVDSGLVARQLRVDRPQLEISDDGARAYRRIRDGIDGIAARLYGDFSTDELAVAGRVLATVTERANAALAS